RPGLPSRAMTPRRDKSIPKRERSRGQRVFLRLHVSIEWRLQVWLRFQSGPTYTRRTHLQPQALARPEEWLSLAVCWDTLRRRNARGGPEWNRPQDKET